MSEPVSAMKKANFNGYVNVQDAGLCGMITLRADLSDAKVQKAVAKAAKVDMVDRGQAHLSGEHGLLWMSPDELLILTPYDQAGDVAAALSKALAKQHALVANASDMRAVFTLRGEESQVREVLAKLTPADVSVHGLQAGQVRRTRLAQVAGAVWVVEPGTIRVVTMRSVARYAYKALCNAAAAGGQVSH